jgi:cytochrome c553
MNPIEEPVVVQEENSETSQLQAQLQTALNELATAQRTISIMEKMANIIADQRNAALNDLAQHKATKE